MIPKENILDVDFEEVDESSKNYKMDIEVRKIRGYASQREAMKQVIYKILLTERYDYIIYSWDYGIELKDLFGQPVTFVCAELIDRIKEALLVDDRIEDVVDFKFDFPKKRVVAVSFRAETIFGDIDIKKELAI